MIAVLETARQGCLLSRFRWSSFEFMGGRMIQDSEHGKRLAQNLVELLAPYEEELIQLEQDAPAFGPLRRALGIAIAEACYVISDMPSRAENVVPPADDPASQTR
ncbi:hypothetical protein [Phenylobacterium sp.]|uniref:hypothetical protein n=1 Tax=Phenylobacterium sp. TaxID=1871053 RepID=UPI00301B7BAA